MFDKRKSHIQHFGQSDDLSDSIDRNYASKFRSICERTAGDAGTRASAAPKWLNFLVFFDNIFDYRDLWPPERLMRERTAGAEAPEFRFDFISAAAVAPPPAPISRRLFLWNARSREIGEDKNGTEIKKNVKRKSSNIIMQRNVARVAREKAKSEV